MQEGNPPSAGAATGRPVDELVARGSAGFERGVEIGDPETEMMDSGPVALEELRDRGAGLGRGEQLDLGRAEPQGNYSGAVGIFLRTRREAEDIAVERESLVEVGYSDADMGQARLRRCGHEP